MDAPAVGDRKPRTGWLTRRSPTDEGGNATVEFAIIGVLFFFLIAIAIQGAIIFNRWLIITDVSTQAARYGAPCVNRSVQGCSVTDVQNYATQLANGVLGTTPATVVVSSDTGTGLITVSATCTVPRVAPFVEVVLPKSTMLTATASMRLENGGS
jgi:Flp pilus assembly protein TadG